tara:strand:+ start:540 stop:1025 length:486 start_codon:yes stop_codon:yes gene_type:complete
MATSNAATNYLERRILNFIFKNNAQIGGANFGSGNSNGLGNNIYVGLATAVTNTGELGSSEITEADFNGYTRIQVPAAKWDIVANDTTDTQTAKNNDNIEFNAHSGGSSPGDAADVISHVFLADASTSGNILFVGDLDSPKTIAQGDIFRINTNNLTIELK